MNSWHWCPDCHQSVPDNEWAAYGRHEDCAMNPARVGAAGYGSRPTLREMMQGHILMGTLAFPKRSGKYVGAE